MPDLLSSVIELLDDKKSDGSAALQTGERPLRCT
jgi:hypothetical protein